MPEIDPLISTDAAAHMLGISVNYLRQRQKTGPIPGHFTSPPFIKIGRRIFYRLSAVEKHIADHEMMPGDLVPAE